MEKPLVAIVGRPNTGKSTFFNRMAGRRISIVENVPGVTRDRIYADTEWCGYGFTLIDTGGLEIKSEDEMWMHIRKQAELAVEMADVILFFVDGKEGLVADDIAVADYLRKTKKPVILAVNKIDNNQVELTFDFYQLGLGEPIPISSEQGKNLGDLLDLVVEKFKERISLDAEQDSIKIAVVGRPNAGKSSLVNKLLGYERQIVSTIAGTTRDAIDSPFSYNSKNYTLVDTAGIRRKNKVEENVEYYSVVRAFNAIRRADVVLMLIDSSEDITEQDIRICGFIHEAGKPSVIVMNKWDSVEKNTYTINEFNKRLQEDLKFMDYFQPVYISALTGQRVNTVMETVEKVYENASRRIATGVLNDVIHDAMAANEAPSVNGRRLKVLYVTQGDTNPPTFIMFVNDITLMHFSYRRYLLNCLRKAFDFSGTPIKIILKNRSEKEAE